MIEEYSKVKIKQTGDVGEVIDIAKAKSKRIYIVELYSEDKGFYFDYREERELEVIS